MDELIENLIYPDDTITIPYKVESLVIENWKKEQESKSLCKQMDLVAKKMSKYDVIDCRSGKGYKIWSIRNDKKGFPHFLIYDNNQWKWQSAKHFKPIEENIK